MAIQFHPDASEPIVLPLACDPSIIGANSPEAIADYLADSNPSRLTVPNDSTIVTIVPMGTRARARLQRTRDEHPGDDAQDGAKSEWLIVFSLMQCEVGVKRISDFPDVVPTTLMSSGLELYPRAKLDLLGAAAIAEIAAHIRRHSELDAGKAPSLERPSGSPTSASQECGTASTASTMSDSSSNGANATAHSSQASSAPPSATA